MASHIDFGVKGENIAVDYLKKQGYEILFTNWRHKNWEIDIVARDKNMLIIVEVKTRKSSLYGNPEEAVHKKKQQFLVQACNVLIHEIAHEGEARFDVVAIVKNGNEQDILHIKDAFYPYDMDFADVL